jgi:hypothetical protein
VGAATLSSVGMNPSQFNGTRFNFLLPQCGSGGQQGQNGTEFITSQAQNTPLPTNTQPPPNTAAPQPTRTPIPPTLPPTATRTPGPTALPTATPRPTNTQAPTPRPTRAGGGGGDAD